MALDWPDASTEPAQIAQTGQDLWDLSLTRYDPGFDSSWLGYDAILADLEPSDQANWAGHPANQAREGNVPGT